MPMKTMPLKASVNGDALLRLRELNALRSSATSYFNEIVKESEHVLNQPRDIREDGLVSLSLKLKHCVEDLRSTFDYVSFAIHQRYDCNAQCKIDKQIYFPICGDPDSFSARIGTYFSKCPARTVSNIFERFQDYSRSDSGKTLATLNGITIILKHRLLKVSFVGENARMEVSAGQYPFYKSDPGTITRRIRMVPHISLRPRPGHIGMDQVVTRTLIAVFENRQIPVIKFLRSASSLCTDMCSMFADEVARTAGVYPVHPV
jgi:hypothetical protein